MPHRVHDRTTLGDLDGFDFATVTETADVLRVDVRTVRRRIADGTFPSVQIGSEYRVPCAWLRQQARPVVAGSAA
jgi:excisionase family DNA binding protein